MARTSSADNGTNTWRGEYWLWVACALVVALAAPCWAAEPKAAAKKEKPAAKAPKEPAAKAPKEPGAKAPKEPGAKAGKAAKDTGEKPAPKPLEPAAAAVLESKPTTPAELARAAKILADLGRFDLAKGFLTKLLAAKLDDAQWADLAARQGTAIFLQLSGRPELQPEAGEVAKALLGALSRQAQQPDRITRFIAQLSDPNADVRHAAMLGLLDAGSAAVNPLLAALADPKRAAEHERIRAATARLGAAAAGGLVAALEANDPGLVVQVVQVLAEMGLGDRAIYLLAPLLATDSSPAVRQAAATALGRTTVPPTATREAIGLLSGRAREYLQGRQRLPSTVDGRVTVWTWDPQKRQAVAALYLAHDASDQIAARLARDAYRIAPMDPEVQVLYALAMLEASGVPDPQAKTAASSAAAEAGRMDLVRLERVLAEALRGGHLAAALAVIGLLPQKGKADALLGRAGQPAVLVQATRSPDRRIRLAAARAVLSLKPQRPFAGASYVTDAVTFLASSTGTSRALLGGPNPPLLLQAAGPLSAKGIALDTAANGRDFVRQALSSPDYELALVDVGIDQPPADPVLQQLRHDSRTAWLPVGVVAREGLLARAEHLADPARLVLAFPRAHDAAGIKWQVGQLEELLGPRKVTAAERQAQAGAALDLLPLMLEPPGLFDLARVQGAALNALHNRDLAGKALVVLGQIRSSQSQQAMLDTASDATQTFELRKAAAVAFQQSTQRYGLLLTSVQIRRQYDRYNQSATEDLATQRLLGLLLDAMEAPTLAATPPVLSPPGGIPAAPRGK